VPGRYLKTRALSLSLSLSLCLTDSLHSVESTSAYPKPFPAPSGLEPTEELREHLAPVHPALQRLLTNFHPIVLLYIQGAISECAGVAHAMSTQSNGKSVVLCLNPPRNATEEGLFAQVRFRSMTPRLLIDTKGSRMMLVVPWIDYRPRGITVLQQLGVAAS